MIRLIFKNHKARGYATVRYSSSDPEEVVCPIDEKEIEELSGKPWREGYRGLKLGKTPDRDNNGRGIPGPDKGEPPGISRAVDRADVELEFDASVFEEEEEELESKE